MNRNSVNVEEAFYLLAQEVFIRSDMKCPVSETQSIFLQHLCEIVLSQFSSFSISDSGASRTSCGEGELSN